ncbi:hypothetical protein SLEP1_g42435 [Rubroshorea leprosula]|uniref:Uncharacterized protein n=1 Tax=Rubroshorea leprosula TaxID=152421 RepID=A0AAV5L9S5_9ROSI|nr:hypothetical protein SLEP1_g42435 [Rubroshorea leprosula]
MEPSFRLPSALPLPYHHHHHIIPCPVHHHHHLIPCRHHHYHHAVPTNSHLCPSFLFPHPPAQIPQPGPNFPLQNNFNSDPSAVFDKAQHSCNLIFQEQGEFEHADEEEEEEEPVFVLTEEWREFFAKSEAKRKQEKKQAKKK